MTTSRHEKVTYENEKGESIVLSYSFPYFFTNLTGADGINANIYKINSVGQDGSVVISTTLADRELEISGGIKGYSKSEMAIYRKDLIRIFSPKKKGVLFYEYGELKRKIECQVETGPRFQKVNNEYRMQEFIIGLICPDPNWKDEYETRQEISTWIGGLKFPFSLPFTLKKRGETIQNIYNSGDVETSVKIMFKGPALNPKVENITTGEFIKIERELTTDDTLYITTGFGDKRVEIERSGVRENAFNYIDLESTFFQLQAGDNLIEYTTESELISRGVEIRYYNRYLGI